MLAFMAYYPITEPVGNADKLNTSVRDTAYPPCHETTLEMSSRNSASPDEDVPPRSAVPLSTEEASSRVEEPGHVTEEENVPHEDQEARPTFGHYLQQIEDVPRIYMEKIYENTVHGPCQTVSLCEVNHMDLFSNCQQPLSFLGFGRHPGDRHSMDPTASFHDEDMPSPIPGAYMVPKSCEYCGSPDTNQCCTETCPRPKMFFHKKRPPFAAPDPDKWDPNTDEAICQETISLPLLQEQQRKPLERQSTELSEQEEADQAVENRKYWVRSLFGGAPPTV